MKRWQWDLVFYIRKRKIRHMVTKISLTLLLILQLPSGPVSKIGRHVGVFSSRYRKNLFLDKSSCTPNSVGSVSLRSEILVHSWHTLEFCVWPFLDSTVRVLVIDLWCRSHRLATGSLVYEGHHYSTVYWKLFAKFLTGCFSQANTQGRRK